MFLHFGNELVEPIIVSLAIYLVFKDTIIIIIFKTASLWIKYFIMATIINKRHFLVVDYLLLNVLKSLLIESFWNVLLNDVVTWKLPIRLDVSFRGHQPREVVTTN